MMNRSETHCKRHASRSVLDFVYAEVCKNTSPKPALVDPLADDERLLERARLPAGPQGDLDGPAVLHGRVRAQQG